MSHRLQVLFDEGEFDRVRAAARRRHLTVSEYVRQTVRDAVVGDPSASVSRKLLVVREAAGHGYPTGEPDALEGEITLGYLSDGP